MEILDRNKVLDYMCEHYEMLHTQGRQWLLEEMEDFISLRKEIRK